MPPFDSNWANPHMRRTVTAVLLTSCTILILFALPGLYAQQFSGVTAEAFNQANLRATTDVNSTLLGQIVVGTRYTGDRAK
jgi:hypothetical protein